MQLKVTTPMRRRAEFRPFGWLNDLYTRKQLDLSPPYQRRSVWSQRFKEDFITTVLLGFPCPAIFLYEEIRTDGSFLYKVVDGKQRLSTLFSFVADEIPVADDFPSPLLRGKNFRDLPDDLKLVVWRYLFGIEFIEQENETVINDIFNRINKNVAKLTAQELRHASWSGEFISSCEELANQIETLLPENFPYITPQSRRQMKDVENVATMLLFLEQGEKSISQADLDAAFSDRDESWEKRAACVSNFTLAINYISDLTKHEPNIAASRLRNQADFYSLFAAVAELQSSANFPSPTEASKRLGVWVEVLKNEGALEALSESNRRYLDAARSASNDPGPRRVRIDTLKRVMLGTHG